MAAKKEKKNNNKKKDSQLVIRISADERDAFVSLCESLDSSASREIRRFMKRFVASNGADRGAEEKV